MRWHLTHARHGNKPWAVQEEAIRRREKSGRTRYGMHLEQGLGKTSLALNEFVSSDAELCVVVCPNSFKADWALAPAEWGVPGISTSVWPWRDTPVSAPKQKHLLAINYEAARSSYDSHRMLLKLLETRRCMLVLDETSCIKNPTSDTAKSAIELAKRATYVRSLNGTPMTLNVLDYYPQLRCLGELNGMRPVIFRARYAKMGGYMGRVPIGIKEDHEDELYRLIDSCAFRALKADWRADLPPQVAVPIHLEMTKRQQTAYFEMMSEFYTVVKGMDVSADMVLTQYDKLRQISSCVAMQNGNMRSIEEPRNNPKIRAVLDVHDGGPGKTIVVYTYKPSGDVLMAALRDLKPAWIRGGMKPGEVVEEKRRFNDDPECRVLVGQQAATCMGHTLLGGEGRDRCNRTIYYENSFSLRDRLQMNDRNHRGDQDQPCTLYDLVTSPMDQLVVDALIAKKSLADSVDEIVKVIRGKKW